MALLTDSYINANNGVLRALSIQDLIFSFVWIAFVALILLIYRSRQSASVYKYFMPFFFFKTFSLLGFVVVYVYNYGGGDSVAFWGLSNALVDLSMKDFSDFIAEMLGNYNHGENGFFKHGIRYPGWIAREEEGYFVSKVGWFFSLISGKNFLLSSLYFMFFSFLSHWRFYRLIQDHFITHNRLWLHILLLFIPSVSFWCTGISKDTLVFIAILNLTYYIIKWFVLKERKIIYILWLCFYSVLLLKTREVVFTAVMVSFLIAWLFTVVNVIDQRFLRTLLRIGLAFVGFASVLIAFYFFGLDELVNAYLLEASIIQGDFISNQIYTGKKYSIGISEFTILNLILSSPIAVITGIFRPFFWESFSPTLLLNGLESTLFLYLFLIKIVFQWRSFSQSIFSHWILLFALVFVVLFGFITGLTSVIFGVLVRLRAPLLIFFVICLYWKDFHKGVGSKKTIDLVKLNENKG